jgi:uncharacterized protein (DUF2147 family)
MKRLIASAALSATLLAVASPARAADASPVGDWLVKDGYANIRMDICNGKLWGIVAWEQKPGGLDAENPDPAKKTRPILGMPILMGLAPSAPGKWSGEIYNSQNGKMYSANVSLPDENTLDLEGCLFTNFMCLTQKWTRVKAPPAGAPPLPPIKGAATPAPAKGQKKGAQAAAGPSDTCLRVADEAAARDRATAKK